jgi:hypothetical protein
MLRPVHWRVGTVTRRRGSWGDAIEYAVRLPPGDGAVAEVVPSGPVAEQVPVPEEVRALGYRSLVGELEAGDTVILNVSALARGLGTGGYAFIVVAPDRLPADPAPGPGHIVKARYTPMQQMTLAVDEQESPHHEALASGAAAEGDLQGLPVVVADLHSALAPILCGLRDRAPGARVAYVMTDGGALPMAFSQNVARLREAGWLTSTVTVGQAFGGDHEAVTLHSGLLAARHVLGADVAVVIQGPGNVGTGTPFGYTGIACGEALNAVSVLGGHAYAALRVSDADPRPRHYGISHHSVTAYGRIALGRATVVVPELPGEFGSLVRSQATELAAGARGDLTLQVESVEGLRAALEASPVTLSTMGRRLDADEAYFLAQAAAGRAVARTLT